jgi:hypothetical protein
MNPVWNPRIAEAAELKERETLRTIFNKNNITTYSFTEPSTFAKYDARFISPNGASYIVEIKCREFPSNQYPTLIIEVAKIDELVRLSSKENTIPILLITYSDGKYFSLECSSIQRRNKIQRRVNKCTSLSREDKVVKTFYEIPLSEVKLKAI